MVTQWSTRCRNAAANAIETTIDAAGGTKTLEIRTGSAPATPATADSGTLLATINLPADAWGNAGATTAGIKNLLATFNGTATTGGTPGHYRLKAGDAVVDCQDIIVVAPTAIPATGGMQISHSPLVAAQPFTVSVMNIITGGA